MNFFRLQKSIVDELNYIQFLNYLKEATDGYILYSDQE